jgi:hypothetical protein
MQRGRRTQKSAVALGCDSDGAGLGFAQWNERLRLNDNRVFLERALPGAYDSRN